MRHAKSFVEFLVAIAIYAQCVVINLVLSDSYGRGLALLICIPFFLGYFFLILRIDLVEKWWHELILGFIALASYGVLRYLYLLQIQLPAKGDGYLPHGYTIALSYVAATFAASCYGVFIFRRVKAWWQERVNGI